MATKTIVMAVCSKCGIGYPHVKLPLPIDSTEKVYCPEHSSE